MICLLSIWLSAIIRKESLNCCYFYFEGILHWLLIHQDEHGFGGSHPFGWQGQCGGGGGFCEQVIAQRS